MAAPRGGSPERAGHAMAYDSARDRLVVFGGWGCCPEWSGQTWEWDGANWSLRSATGPAPRSGATMVYDAARGECVLFGGYSPGPVVPLYHSDTWVWNGAVWTQRQAIGPEPRIAHGMAYDAARARTVLYGGFVSPGPLQGLGDTWEWDGAAWQQMSPAASPGPRYHHAMAWAPGLGTVLHGGGEPDTWVWDGAAWTRLPTTGPGRLGHRMAFDAARGKLVFLAGYREPGVLASGGQWEWTPAAWVQQGAPAPIGMWTGLAYHSGRGRLVFYGGDTSEMTAPPNFKTIELVCGACYANCDLGTVPPVLNIADFVCFQNRFAAGDPYANCDGSTVAPNLNVADFVCFLNRYAAGCP